MRYLWGQGRVARGAAGEEDDGGGAGLLWVKGEVVVGAGEMWWVKRWGTVAGVTLSM